jgi:hypothetical protein
MKGKMTSDDVSTDEGVPYSFVFQSLWIKIEELAPEFSTK